MGQERIYTIPGALRDAVARWPDKVWLDFSGDQRTFAEADRESTCQAHGLTAIGVERGDRVCSILDNSADEPDSEASQRCFGQIRTIHGVPFSGPLQETWKRRFGVRNAGAVGYGMTEACSITLADLEQPSPPRRLAHPGGSVPLVDRAAPRFRGAALHRISHRGASHAHRPRPEIPAARGRSDCIHLGPAPFGLAACARQAHSRRDAVEQDKG